MFRIRWGVSSGSYTVRNQPCCLFGRKAIEGRKSLEQKVKSRSFVDLSVSLFSCVILCTEFDDLFSFGRQFWGGSHSVVAHFVDFCH